MTTAPVVRVRNLEGFGSRTNREFSSIVTVLLKGNSPGDEKTPVSLQTRTHEEPHRGSGLRVMYAPSDLSLGAVHGDAATLRRLVKGRSMTAGLTWGLSLAMAGIAVILMATSLKSGVFNGLRRLGGEHRALRGVCVGVASAPSSSGSTNSDDCVVFRCEGGARLNFRPERNAAAIAEAIGNDPVWACWRAIAQGANNRGRSPGVLVGDSGWALHGDFLTDEIRKSEGFSAHVVGSVDAPVDAERRVGLWSPITSWPLIVPARSLICVGDCLARPSRVSERLQRSVALDSGCRRGRGSTGGCSDVYRPCDETRRVERERHPGWAP